MKNLLYLVLLIMLLVACEEDKFAIPDSENKIVINSLITNDSLFGVNVSSSMRIDDSSRTVNDVYFKNANISLFENKIFRDSLSYSNSFKTFFFNDLIKPNNYRSKKLYPVSGNNYKIIVSAQGMFEASAITTIPTLVKIERVDTARIKVEKTEAWQSDKKMNCDIVFTDPGNEKNFYLIYIFSSANTSTPVLSSFDLTFQDPIIEEELKQGSSTFGVVFSDKSINGQQHKFRIILKGKFFQLQDYELNGPVKIYKKSVYFRLYSITEDYFKYIQTLNLFLKNYKNPLAEPTQVYSNVEGGYGIFAGAAVSSDSLIFQY